MNKDNQIEEMAVELWHNTTIREADMCDDVAEYLYNAGYRKASEIFEEIETSLQIADFKGSEVYYVIRADDYIHYKKKYLEEGK